MSDSAYPVFIRPGDRLNEVRTLVEGLGGAGSAGLHRHMYVARADQTVVMVTGRDAPIAVALRDRGWAEPRE